MIIFGDLLPVETLLGFMIRTNWSPSECAALDPLYDLFLKFALKWFFSSFQLFRLSAVAHGPAEFRRGQTQPKLRQLLPRSSWIGPPNE